MLVKNIRTFSACMVYKIILKKKVECQVKSISTFNHAPLPNRTVAFENVCFCQIQMFQATALVHWTSQMCF